jgi:hypothetical protein
MKIDNGVEKRKLKKEATKQGTSSIAIVSNSSCSPQNLLPLLQSARGGQIYNNVRRKILEYVNLMTRLG